MTTTTRGFTPPNAGRSARERKERTRMVAGGMLGGIICVFWLLPLLLVFMNAFKDKREYNMGESWRLPQSFHLWENLQNAWAQGLGSGFVNSLSYGLVGAAGAILLASLAAFGIVRLKMPRGLWWFLLIYSGTIFPFQVYLIPLFKAYTSFGLYDTWIGMVLFYIAICIPFCTFVMRGFFVSMPWDFQEAAKLDGCNDWMIFWKIMLPLTRAPMLVLLLFQFTWIWNDLLFGLVLSKSENVRPIMPTLAGMQGIYAGSDGPTLIAAVMIASLPTLLLFLLLRPYFMQGLRLSSVGD
ncbi:carbohydrate ABC transporter permease [Deinococcus humi]|uniref:Multiple sugar transport system permease protein n=1 Tax=Deinococcus humi TaxID=662880 RepID=A0A7W8JWR0_9DEIO|nr:carbohydrate ABC transporter permease [Deinococcus humi]MBB5364625.1 multiple sugar transport system permease protein [Deinococcus humi]GGO39115.1 permease [Deinococcus humi]